MFTENSENNAEIVLRKIAESDNYCLFEFITKQLFFQSPYKKSSPVTSVRETIQTPVKTSICHGVNFMKY